MKRKTPRAQTPAPQVPPSGLWAEVQPKLLDIARNDPWLQGYLHTCASQATTPGRLLWQVAIAMGTVAQICEYSPKQRRDWVQARLRGQEPTEEWPWRWMRTLPRPKRDELSHSLEEAITQWEEALCQSQQLTATASRAEIKEVCRSLLAQRADIDAAMWCLQEDEAMSQPLADRLAHVDEGAQVLLTSFGCVEQIIGDDERFKRLQARTAFPWA